jgi:hypothetical protein
MAPPSHQLGQHRPAHAADAELQPLQVLDALELVAEEAAHLAAGIAAGDRIGAEAVEHAVDDLLAPAEIPPAVLLAGVQAEWNAGSEPQRRVLADVEIGRRMRAFDSAGGNRVERLQAGHDLAGREDLNLELAVGGVADELGKLLRRAEDRVERLREARGQPPLHLGLRLRDRGHGDRGRGGGQSACFQKVAAFHKVILPRACSVLIGPSGEE